jgi:class 3 adenylate cyclase/HAMP domain-containing protein
MVQFIMAGCLALYFLSFRQKVRATWLLVFFFGAATLLELTQALFTATLAPYDLFFSHLAYVFVLPGLTSLIAFAYAFPVNTHPRESRIVLGVTVAISGLVAGYILVNLVLRGLDFTMIPSFVLEGTALAMSVWAISVFLRKARRTGPAGRAHRAFALSFLFLPLALLSLVLSGFGLITIDTGNLFSNLSLLLFLAGFALVYINHAPHPTSFQVKLVGLSLFTVLAVLTIISRVLFPTERLWQEQSTPLPGAQSLRFEPVAGDAYRVESIPFQYDPEVGEALAPVAGEEGGVSLGFAFPFYGMRSQDVYIHPNATVTFGGGWDPIYLEEFYDALPKIGVLSTALDMAEGGGIYLKREPGKATITWRNMMPFEQDTPLTMQLVLFEDGAFAFNYEPAEGVIGWGMRGVYPGERPPNLTSRLTADLPEQGTGPALVQDFHLQTRARIHAQLAPLALSLFGAAGFIVLVFPFFFHVSLVKPLGRLLGGVQRVNDGDLGTVVPVGVGDEIGRLTAHFNQMTGSLQQAHHELKDYAEHLEDKVAERTQELAQKNEENERLLLNILPEPIAERLKRSDEPIADAFAEVTVLFADLVGFTTLSQHTPAADLVALLNELFSDFDALSIEHGVEKIKTIGDAYMAVSGLPEERDDHAEAMAAMALDMIGALDRFNARNGTALRLRVGLNTGPVVAGVIGTHKFIYDLWGDAVNTAARMESHGVPGRVHVTEATYACLAADFVFDARGEIEVKGKGRMRTYLLKAKKHQPTSLQETLPA